MTDTAPLTLEAPAREALFLVDIWDDRAGVEQRLAAVLPAPCRSRTEGLDRLIWWEPSRWLIRTPLAGRSARHVELTAAVRRDGAVTEVSGGLYRLRVKGSAWRALLMIGGVFDAESPAFAPGSVAGTLIHHLAVRLDVIDEETLDVYIPPSYAAELLRHWDRAIARLNVLAAV